MAKEKKEVRLKIPHPVKKFKQSEKRRLRNRAFKSRVRTSIRSFEAALSAEDKKEKTKRLNEVYSLMDQAVSKGIFKLNKASRTKARLAAKLAAA